MRCARITSSHTSRTAPREAPEAVCARVHYVAQAAAGRGAVREVCELLMRAQRTYDQALAKYLA